MKYGSLFSGAGGFEIGLNKLGWECQWMCENDPYPASVLSYHWPEIPVYDDVFNMDGSSITPVDVVVGGFPCTSFSVAGKKTGEGLAVFREFVRIVDEMRKATNGEYPRAVMWENVPGILNSKQTWISDIYTAWGEIGALVQEHRIVDARYLGVPHRRRRVLGVVIFDSSADCSREILFDTESLSGNFGPSGEEGQEFTSDTSGFSVEGSQTGVDVLPLPTIINSWYKGPGNTQVETGVIIPFNPTQITHPANRDNPKSGDLVGGLSKSAKPPHIICFHPKQDPIPKANFSHCISKASDSSVAVQFDNVVRKLTPLECERLMSWKDNHTEFGIVKGKIKPISDSRRYMMCGNGLVSNMATWAGNRLESFFSN